MEKVSSYCDSLRSERTENSSSEDIAQWDKVMRGAWRLVSDDDAVNRNLGQMDNYLRMGLCGLVDPS